MYDESRPVPTALRRLASAAALAHVLPQVAVEVGVRCGHRLLIAHRADLGPDLAPCDLRRLVARLSADDGVAVGFGWLREVDDITVGGVGVTTTDGVVVLPDEQCGGGSVAFTTDLDTPLVMSSARRWAEEAVADDPRAAAVLGDVRLRVDRDDLLATSVVTIPWDRDDRDAAVLVAAALSARCAVDALLGAALTRRG